MEAVFTLPVRSRSLTRRLNDEEKALRMDRVRQAISALGQQLDPCVLCPRQCGARRLTGETGECGLGGGLRVASVARHSGEEPPISGRRGAINVFFSGCNLHCLHCQNWPLSQNRVGRDLSPRELADHILKKWARGAQTLGWVTPTPQIVGALEVYQICLEEGCDLPLVHNGGGYESAEVIELLAGIVDLWLPDAKTADPDRGETIQGVRNYPERNQAALTAMMAQVDSDLARAVIVRHLILPGGLEDSRRVLSRLWESFGDRIYLSLMSQYFPTYRSQGHATLGRNITTEEYEEIVVFARKLGFRKGWIQQFETEDGISLHCLS